MELGLVGEVWGQVLDLALAPVWDWVLEMDLVLALAHVLDEEMVATCLQYAFSHPSCGPHAPIEVARPLPAYLLGYSAAGIL